MKYKKIPISAIDVPEIRVTAVYDEELQEQLHSSLDTLGQIEPIVVIEEGESFILVDGLHRLQEAQARGDTKIQAVVAPGDSITAAVFNIATNRMRGKTRASDLVRVVDWLVHEKGLDSDQIKEQTGMTRDYVERLWKIAEASLSVKAALDEELIGVGVAYEISRLPDHIQQDLVMSTVSVYHTTVQETKDLVDEVLREMQTMAGAPAEQTPVERPEPPPPTCDVCGREEQIRWLASVRICRQCVSGAQEHHSGPVEPAQ